MNGGLEVTASNILARSCDVQSHLSRSPDPHTSSVLAIIVAVEYEPHSPFQKPAFPRRRLVPGYYGHNVPYRSLAPDAALVVSRCRRCFNLHALYLGSHPARSHAVIVLSPTISSTKCVPRLFHGVHALL